MKMRAGFYRASIGFEKNLISKKNFKKYLKKRIWCEIFLSFYFPMLARSLLLSGRALRPLIQTTSYHDTVIDHYENPRNVGSFDKNSKVVGTGIVGAPACGDVMKIQIKVEDDVIKDVVFKTFGCGSAIASSSLATEWVKGKTLDQALAIKDKEIAAHFSLPPIKKHCSMLAEDAIKAAINDYKKKQTVQ